MKVKWSFGLPGDIVAYGQPAVAGGRVFFGSARGGVYSLDSQTGCIHWTLRALAPVRTAMTIGRLSPPDPPRYVVYFGDQSGNVYAAAVDTGELLWKRRVDDHPEARITGALQVHGGRLYVPVTSAEEGSGADARYECCTFRGSVVALDVANGKQIWKTYTIAEPARPTRKNKIGVQLHGPSGAGIWSAPTVDPERGVLYVATGDNYSDPPTNTSDAILALDLETGSITWSRQFTRNDAWNLACVLPDTTNCPEAEGPDYDFGSSPILVSLSDARRVLVAGQKSGMVHALDPDRKGSIIWQVRVATGGVTLGGVQWGSAADAQNVYVAVSDLEYGVKKDPELGVRLEPDPKVGGGLFALRLTTGEQVWYAPPPECGIRERCSPAQSAAVTLIPGVVFSGSLDGHLRAYSTKDGRVLWDFDTVREYETVNAVPAKGGSLDGPGPVVVDGMLYVNSGYGTSAGIAGNVLLAFATDGK